MEYGHYDNLMPELSRQCPELYYKNFTRMNRQLFDEIVECVTLSEGSWRRRKFCERRGWRMVFFCERTVENSHPMIVKYPSLDVAITTHWVALVRFRPTAIKIAD